MDVADTTCIDLLRHGEPVGGTRFRGARDDPLSVLGWEQMRTAVDGDAPWDAVVSSPLRRCLEFARELAERHGLPLRVDERLHELRFGAWEGRIPEELAAEQPEALAAFWADPVGHMPPGGEPFAAFRERVLAAWADLVHGEDGRHVLVVAHGGVNRVLLAQVLGMPTAHLFRIEVPFAALSRVAVSAGLPRLVFHRAAS